MLEMKREFENRDWSTERGLGTGDINQFMLLIRAEPERVSQALEMQFGPSIKDAVGKTVMPGKANLIMFRIKGHSWTTITRVDQRDLTESLRRLGVSLSKDLQAPAVFYAGSDTADAYGYDRWDSGTQVEHFETGQDKPEFWTKLPNRKAPASRNPGTDYIDRTFKDWGLLVPEFDGDYFLFNKEARRGERYMIVNPGSECNFGPLGIAVSRPTLDHVEFFAGR
jgi:hypothetical protein